MHTAGVRGREHIESRILVFDSYGFAGETFNTRRSSVVHAGCECLAPRDLDNLAGPPQEGWLGRIPGYISMARSFDEAGFLGPVKIAWTALDGVDRRFTIDLKRVFKRWDALPVENGRIVSGTDQATRGEFINIVVAVDDRTLGVYLRAIHAWDVPQKPLETRLGMPWADKFNLAWERTF